MAGLLTSLVIASLPLPLLSFHLFTLEPIGASLPPNTSAPSNHNSILLEGGNDDIDVLQSLVKGTYDTLPGIPLVDKLDKANISSPVKSRLYTFKYCK